MGFGHLCAPDHAPITETKGEVYLAQDLVTALHATLRYCPVPATEPEGRLAAIIEFTSNLGGGRLQASTLRRRIDQRDWAGAAQEWRRWVYGGGRVLPGRLARREAEAPLLSRDPRQRTCVLGAMQASLRSPGSPTARSRPETAACYTGASDQLQNGKTMNKKEFIDSIAAQYEHLSRAEVARIVETIIDTLGTEMKRGRKVQITGFGTFGGVRRKARKGRNPKTGEAIKVPATTVPKFTPGATLKALVNKKKFD